MYWKIKGGLLSKMCIKGIIKLCPVLLLVACGTNNKKDIEWAEEDLTAKEMLQGIWLDDDTEMPILRVKGDTIYYVDPQNAPVNFKVVQDTIYMYGNEPIAYKINRQTEYSFWFHSLSDEIIKLHKSETPEDSLAFTVQGVEVIPTIPKVLQKDSVVMYNGTRYRGYVYINPSKMKVIKTSYSENGYTVDNVYYDNVIHICVYEGRKLLYGRDITKKIFSGIFSDEFLNQTILADMNFMGVDSKGYHYQATLCIPESSVSNLVNISIGFNNKMEIKR